MGAESGVSSFRSVWYDRECLEVGSLLRVGYSSGNYCCSGTNNLLLGRMERGHGVTILGRRGSIGDDR